MKKARERGAIVVDATISLTAFIFAMLMIILLVDVAFVQCKVAIALNGAAKEMAQWTSLYYKFGLDKIDNSIAPDEATAQASETANATLQGMNDVMGSLGNIEADAQALNLQGLIDDIGDGTGAITDTMETAASGMAANPGEFALGMGKLALLNGKEKAKAMLAQVLIKGMMEKNLRASGTQDPDVFLRRLRVIDGMDGLNFQYTTFLPYGENEMNLVCTYQVKVIDILNVDFAFTFRQMAKAIAWGKGVSILDPTSIWESLPPLARGNYIVGQERDKYTLRSRDNGFDAYDNSGGKNEFITITSIDPTLGSYQTVDGITDRLTQMYNSLDRGVSRLGDPIPVKDTSGNAVAVASDPSTRTYRMKVVIPEGLTTEERNRVDQAISALKANNPDVPLEVDVVVGYGEVQRKEENDGDSES